MIVIFTSKNCNLIGAEQDYDGLNTMKSDKKAGKISYQKVYNWPDLGCSDFQSSFKFCS